MAAILDHIGLGYADYDRAKSFFSQALAPLGIGLVMEVGEGGHRACGFGRGKPDFWIAAGARTSPRIHVAFVAEDRAAVRAFYEAALKAGAIDNGPPGIRAHYHPDYYGAFVLDPEGQNIEAVCHRPE
jgi:catechol 2,3-dioxygenase-like lactoylglutathione lyase family enzyme